MGAGRPRKTKEEKEANGTLRSDRENNVPEFDNAPESVDLPSYLTEYGKEYFNKHYPLLQKTGVLKVTDLDAFFYLCFVRQELRECDETIAREGNVIRGSKENEVMHPACRARKEYSADFLRMAAHFGLTPTSRQNLNIATDDKASDPKPRERDNQLPPPSEG